MPAFDYPICCEKCGEETEVWALEENGYCIGCNEPSPAELAALYAEYQGAKSAGLTDSPEEHRAKLHDAGRGHLVR